MIYAFVLVGATAKFLNLRLKKRREALKAQENMMGHGNIRETHPEELKLVHVEN